MRSLWSLFLVPLGWLSAVLMSSIDVSSKLQAQSFFIGGYADGIYASHIDPNGKMETPRKVGAQHTPSFLAMHPTLDVVYAVTESGRNETLHPPSVVAHGLRWGSDRKSLEKLERLSEQPVDGDHPCFVSVDGTGKLLAVANYSSGSIALYRLDREGKIMPHPQIVDHRGTGPDKERQSSPHAHCAVFDPSNQWLVAADLGADNVFVYRVDHEHGTLAPSQHPSMTTAPGSGPRHVSFHPNGRFAFVINEMNLTLTSATWDSAQGKLTLIESISTVPPGISTDGFSTAEVLVHPSGKFVYGSNRGHHSIAAFAFDEAAQRLKLVGIYPTGGKTPRNFRLTPDGKFLLAENQESDTIGSFRVNLETGALRSTNESIAQKSPACIKFFSR